MLSATLIILVWTNAIKNDFLLETYIFPQRTQILTLAGSSFLRNIVVNFLHGSSPNFILILKLAWITCGTLSRSVGGQYDLIKISA